MLQRDQILETRYRILDPLKRGGFGMAYKAWEEHQDIYCAIKDNQLETEDAKKQFTREAKVLAQLKHPNRG